MIIADSKVETKRSLPLSLSTPSDEPTLSFSQLLKGVAVEFKSEAKILKEGLMLPSLTKEEPVETLPSLVELNPKLTLVMTPQELKVLLSDAKKYLKEKILEMPSYKESQNKELPKTLNGLLKMAKNFGIDVQKITLEEVSQNIKTELLQDKLQGKKGDLESTLESVISEKKEVPKRAVKELLSKQGDKLEKNEMPVAITNVKSEKVEKVTTAVAATDIKEEKNEKNQKQELPLEKVVSRSEESVKSKVLISTPLFKESRPEVVTQHIVQARSAIQEQKTTKYKAGETLKRLLSGDKMLKADGNLTADFSVATARVIAPEATKDASGSLEDLLRGDEKESSLNKLDRLSVSKEDSFEVKLKEAKQMTKYLSQDVKSAIEDYKSPFTRIKVQLNPQRLGEVDLTIVQRGKNLHINLSSNNTAINTLALNANDLKAQLSTNGINNATLNFNNNSQSPESGFSGQGQQNPQNGREAKREYDYFENEEKHEEITSSLEIVVPYYA